MLIAGLTGGLGCGKTFVAGALRDLGCYVVEADHLGRAALEPGGGAYAATVKAFGEAILRDDKTIDRSRLAAIVFKDPTAIERLNAIVHPVVRRMAQEQFDEIAARDPDAIVIYVAAILVETGGYREFSRLIVVTCSPEQQMERALARPGATPEDVKARLARQLPSAKKAAVADYLIDAGGTIEETLRQTKIVFEELRRIS
jgi:dephospho-CoA kinase